MKFEEKLMKLRKEKALSQEELAEKLSVTRQTISKWELGQTKPDAEKLGEIAKFFEVSTDELLNDSEDPIKSKEKSENPKRTVIIVIILIVALFAILGWSLYSLFFNMINGVNKESKGVLNFVTNKMERQINDQGNTTEKFGEQFNNISGQIKEEYNNDVNKINEQYNKEEKKIIDEHDIYSHNHVFENLYTGLENKFFTETAVKEVIKNNLNSDKKITVKYKKTTAKSSKELTNLIKKLNKKEYLISYKKDSDGYINQMIIKNV